MNSDAHSILVVDDDAETRFVLALCLRHLGYEVTVATGGREAIDFLERRSFDVVITDMLMPDTDGLEVITAVRKLHFGTGIVAMTGGGEYLETAHLLKLGRLLGADVQLSKPFSRECLTQAVDRLCSDRGVVAA